MGATLRLTRRGGMSPGCARVLKVELDGKMVQPIGAGKSVDYPLGPGGHRIRVKQDWLWSEQATFQVKDGDVAPMDCGCLVEGWITLLIPFWFWRTLVPRTLWFVRRAER